MTRQPKPTPTETETTPAKKRQRVSPPSKFVLAARAESELKRVGSVITNAQKRLGEAIARRKALLEKLPAEVRELLGVAEEGGK